MQTHYASTAGVKRILTTFLHCIANTVERDILKTALQNTLYTGSLNTKKLLTADDHEILNAVFQYIEDTGYTKIIL